MANVILKAQVRTETGKRVAKDLRNQGLVPANVYKGSKGAVSLQVIKNDLREVLSTKAGENVIITLKVSGAPDAHDKTVLIKEIQREPIMDEILHVDFGEISLSETLKVNIPLVSKGESVGVKVDDGVLEHIMWELQVECLPMNIPEKIEVNVSDMKIGDSIFVKNIIAPEGVKILNDSELIVVSVKAKKIEVPKEELEAEGAEAPELIRKKKEEGEEELSEAPKEAGKEAAKESKKE